MDLADIVLEYDELVSAISALKSGEESEPYSEYFDEKGIDILRIGNVSLRGKRIKPEDKKAEIISSGANSGIWLIR